MKVVSIISTKGGVGKTTTAANLGGFAADAGLRVLLVDLDVQPALSSYFEFSDRALAGVYELLAFNDNNLDRVVSRTTIPGLDLVIAVLGCDQDFAGVEHHGQQRVARLARGRFRGFAALAADGRLERDERQTQASGDFGAVPAPLLARSLQTVIDVQQAQRGEAPPVPREHVGEHRGIDATAECDGNCRTRAGEIEQAGDHRLRELRWHRCAHGPTYT